MRSFRTGKLSKGVPASEHRSTECQHKSCGAEWSIGAEGCAAVRRGGSEPPSRGLCSGASEHWSGGLRSGAEWSIGASERKSCRTRWSGASERRVAQRRGAEHRSGGLRSGAEWSIGGSERSSAAHGVEHRSGGLRSAQRSGVEHRSIGAEEMEWSLILAPLLLWPHLFAGIFVTEQEAMGHKAVDSFQEHALKVFGFAMFVAKLLSHDGLRKARSLQQRQAMNKE